VWGRSHEFHLKFNYFLRGERIFKKDQDFFTTMSYFYVLPDTMYYAAELLMLFLSKTLISVRTGYTSTVIN